MNFLKILGINVNSLPKEFPKSLYSFLLVLVIIGYAYLLFIFWVKINIIQTLLVIFACAIPCSFIFYKALKNIKIEI